MNQDAGQRDIIYNSIKLILYWFFFQGVRYYLNIDRCAFGGVIAVRSSLDNTPQVRGAEVFAVTTNCSVFYEEDGYWKPYQSARRIQCMRSNRLISSQECCNQY